MSKPQRRWSPEEDAVLQKEARLQCAVSDDPSLCPLLRSLSLTRWFICLATSGAANDWNLIAQKIKGRSNKDCRKRYYNSIAGGLKKVGLFSGLHLMSYT